MRNQLCSSMVAELPGNPQFIMLTIQNPLCSQILPQATMNVTGNSSFFKKKFEAQLCISFYMIQCYSMYCQEYYSETCEIALTPSQLIGPIKPTAAYSDSPRLPKGSDTGLSWTCSLLVILEMRGTEPRTSCKQSMCSTTEL